MKRSGDSARRMWNRISLVLIAVLGIGLIYAGGVAVTSWAAATSTHGPIGKDMRGNTVQLDVDGAVPPPSSTKATANDGGRLMVPSVGLNVPLGSLNEVDGWIVPPGFQSAYRVRNRGVPLADATTGTVFVVMHALRNGAVGPGNYVTDIEKQRSKVADGAVIDVSGTTYTVTGSQLVRKTQMPYAKEIWANTPGRLVLITCLEHPDNSASTDNVVITATLTPGK